MTFTLCLIPTNKKYSLPKNKMYFIHLLALDYSEIQTERNHKTYSTWETAIPGYKTLKKSLSFE